MFHVADVSFAGKALSSVVVISGRINRLEKMAVLVGVSPTRICGIYLPGSVFQDVCPVGTEAFG